MIEALFVGHSAVAAQNFLLLVSGSLVGIRYLIFWLRIRKEPGIEKELLTLVGGISLAGFALAIHRGYWWLWRLQLNAGDAEGAKWFIDNADWLIVAILFIAMSHIIHLLPWVQERFGRWSWPVSIGVACFTYFLGALPGLLN